MNTTTKTRGECYYCGCPTINGYCDDCGKVPTGLAESFTFRTVPAQPQPQSAAPTTPCQHGTTGHCLDCEW